MKYMEKNKFCKEIKNLCNRNKKKFCKIIRSSDFCILKFIKIILLFLKPLGIVSIFCFLVIIIKAFICSIVKKKSFGESYLQIQKKRFCIQNVQDGLVIFSLIALGAILFRNYMPCLVLLLVKWRLIEILVVQLSIIFPKKGKYIITANLFRSILLWLINLMEIISIYAILYLATQGIEIVKCRRLIKPFEAFYFSITTISTTGFGEMIPKKGWGQFLVSSEIIIGILMIVVFLGVLISRWKRRDDRFYKLLRKVNKQMKKMKT